MNFDNCRGCLYSRLPSNGPHISFIFKCLFCRLTSVPNLLGKMLCAILGLSLIICRSSGLKNIAVIGFVFHCCLTLKCKSSMGHSDPLCQFLFSTVHQLWFQILEIDLSQQFLSSPWSIFQSESKCKIFLTSSTFIMNGH